MILLAIFALARQLQAAAFFLGGHAAEVFPTTTHRPAKPAQQQNMSYLKPHNPCTLKRRAQAKPKVPVPKGPPPSGKRVTQRNITIRRNRTKPTSGSKSPNSKRSMHTNHAARRSRNKLDQDDPKDPHPTHDAKQETTQQYCYPQLNPESPLMTITSHK